MVYCTKKYSDQVCYLGLPNSRSETDYSQRIDFRSARFMPQKSPPCVKRSYRATASTIVRLRARVVNIGGRKPSFGPYNIGSERINDENLIAPDFMRPISTLSRSGSRPYSAFGQTGKHENSHHRPHNNHKLCCIFTSVCLRLVV